MLILPSLEGRRLRQPQWLLHTELVFSTHMHADTILTAVFQVKLGKPVSQSQFSSWLFSWGKLNYFTRFFFEVDRWGCLQGSFYVPDAVPVAQQTA